MSSTDPYEIRESFSGWRVMVWFTATPDGRNWYLDEEGLLTKTPISFRTRDDAEAVVAIRLLRDNAG